MSLASSSGISSWMAVTTALVRASSSRSVLGLAGLVLAEGDDKKAYSPPPFE